MSGRRKRRAKTQRVKALKRNGMAYRNGSWWKMVGQWGIGLAYVAGEFLGEVTNYQVDYPPVTITVTT